MMSFNYRLTKLVAEALEAINNYDGSGYIEVLSLKDGSKALDYDDSYIIINNNDEPYIRDKRNQRLYDNGSWTEEQLRDEDTYLLENFEYEDICIIADRLYGIN